MRAYVALRESPHYRRDIFATGLRRLGYNVEFTLRQHPEPNDLLLIWNRYSGFHDTARRFEAVGAKVLVTENSLLGKEARAGEHWLSLALNHHNGAGRWKVGGPERWDSLGIELQPWKDGGHEAVLLLQRGIGAPGVAQPRGFHVKGCRVRAHPGKGGIEIPLDKDLARARCFVTWASGAGLKALILGVPGFAGLPQWVGAPACKPLEAFLRGEEPMRDDAARLAMFRRLAWHIWRRSEIESGEAFRWLIG